MKKLLFITLLAAFTISTATSQKVQKSAIPPKQNTTVYTLTAVRVNIRTGSDNKEFPSDVRVSLWRKDRKGDWANDCFYNTPSLINEMAVNSNTDIGLAKYAGNAEKFNLSNLQMGGGLDLLISYQPNIFTDAWKIENISLTLEFKDQNGNLHPTMGSKTVSFSTAIGFLNADYRGMKCKTDQNFNPLTASIVQ